MRRHRLALAVTAVVMTAGAGCSGAGDTPVDGEPVDREFAEQLAENIERAEAAGAAAEQVEVLEGAIQTGEVPFEAYNESIDRVLRCLRDAGTTPDDHGIYEHMGIKVRGYGVPVDAEAEDGQEPLPGVTVHRCVAEHSFWVELVYQQQPTSIEAELAYWEQYRDPIVECLREHDVEVDPADDITSIVDESDQARRDGRTDVDCLYQAGVGG